MMFVSVLLKTYAVAMLPLCPYATALLWALSLIADIRGFKRDAFLINVAALIAAVALYAGFIEVTTRWKDGLPLFAVPASWLLNAVGFPVAHFHGILHTTTMAGILEFPVSLDSLGLLPPLLFAGFSLIMLLTASPNGSTAARGIAWIAATLFVAMILRWVLTTLLFLSLTDFVSYESEELPILPFFKPGMTAALYLPFLAMAAFLLQRHLGGLTPPTDPDRRRVLPARPLRFALFFALVMVVLWEPTGSPKNGEVLLNTYHAQWSRTDRPYDREWYGPASGYNYACMKRFFERFAPTRELTTRITPEALANTSVLVLFDPDRAFTPDEIRAVQAFVERGGGVLLIGDHTNVFGSTTHLNTICRPFGFIFRDDVLFDLDEDFFQLYDVPRTYSQFLHGMDFFKFRGPASIQATSGFTRTVFRVGHAKSLRAIYSVNNFYPPPHDDPKMRTGEFAASVASRYGRGRVLAFADSTIFSNFEIFYPGKYEYLLNALRWLDHTDSPLTTPIKRLALVAAGILLVVLLVSARHPRRILGTLLAVLIATAAGLALCLLAEQARADFPRPTEPLDALFFATDQDDDPYTLRTFVTEAPYEQKYDVFFQWALRTDVFSGFYLLGPDHKNTLYQTWVESEQARTGMALIIRGPEHLQILEDLDPLREADPLLLMISTNLNREAVMTSLRASGVLDDPSAVEAVWPDGELRIEQGPRRIAVVMPAEKYSDREMGFSEKVTPTEAQLARYQEQFALIDWLFRRAQATVDMQE